MEVTPGQALGERPTVAPLEPPRRLELRSQRRLLVLGLLASDALALVAAAALAYLIRYYAPLGLFRDVELPLALFTPMVLTMLAVWLALFAVMGLYSEHNLLGGTREYALLFNACTAAALLVVLGAYLTEVLIVSRGLLVLGWLLTFLATGVERFVFRRAVYRLRQHGYLLRPTLIVGANAEGMALARQLGENSASGMKVLGFVEEDVAVDSPRGADAATAHRAGAVAALGDGWPVLGGLDDLGRLVERLGIEQLVVAAGSVSRERLLAIVSTYGRSRKVDILFSSGLFEVLTTGVQVQERASVPLISLNKTRLSAVDVIMKATLDLAITVPVLVLLAPVLVLIALAIRLDSRGPIIYRRRVLGLQGIEFDAYKFRTMRVGWEQAVNGEDVRRQFVVGVKPKGDPRVTRVGRVLRRYSLDELPQLANVLKREMSLVGPRMITRQEAGFYGQWLMNLLTVRPGLTGLWQVSGRAETSYEDKVRLDMTYIRNYSIWLDLQILLQTIPVTLRTRGAY